MESEIIITPEGFRYKGVFYKTSEAYPIVKSIVLNLDIRKESLVNEELPSPKENIPCILDIYTDGSHKKHSSKGGLGIGIFCKYKDVEYKLSATVNRSLLLSYGVTETECSNPTAEYIALAETLKILKTRSFHSKSVINIYSDYEGVQKWTNGIWQAKKPYIIKIRDYVVSSIKEIECTVELIRVSSHSGVYGNDMADKLASLGADGVTSDNNFIDLLKVL